MCFAYFLSFVSRAVLFLSRILFIICVRFPILMQKYDKYVGNANLWTEIL